MMARNVTFPKMTKVMGGQLLAVSFWLLTLRNWRLAACSWIVRGQAGGDARLSNG